MRIYYAPSGPDPKSSTPLCGKLELIEGDTATFPSQNALTYRYHPSDTCTDISGASREGPFKLIFNGEWGEEGSFIRVESQEHRSLGLTLRGRIIIERQETEWRFRWKGVSFGTNGEEMRVTGEMTLEQLLGEASPEDPKDDRYRLAPELKGEGFIGTSYAIRSRSEEIERNMGCRWAWKGSLWVKPRDLGERELRYGEGGKCTDSVVVFVNGKAVRSGLETAL